MATHYCLRLSRYCLRRYMAGGRERTRAVTFTEGEGVAVKGKEALRGSEASQAHDHQLRHDVCPCASAALTSGAGRCRIAQEPHRRTWTLAARQARSPAPASMHQRSSIQRLTLRHERRRRRHLARPGSRPRAPSAAFNRPPTARARVAANSGSDRDPIRLVVCGDVSARVPTQPRGSPLTRNPKSEAHMLWKVSCFRLNSCNLELSPSIKTVHLRSGFQLRPPPLLGERRACHRSLVRPQPPFQAFD